MRTKFIYLLLIAAVSGSAAAQDTLSLDDYRLRVLQYSYTLKQAAEQTRAAEAAVRGSYTGFLPQLSADGDFPNEPIYNVWVSACTVPHKDYRTVSAL